MLTDNEIFDLAEPFGAFQYGDAQGDKRIAFARAVEQAAYEAAAAHIDVGIKDYGTEFAQAIRSLMQEQPK